MAALSEAKHTGQFIQAESPGTISRDTVVVTVAAETTLVVGQVLGKITATGKHVPVDNDVTPAADGSEAAAGILYAELENATVAPVDMTGVVVNWGAEVRAADLEWGASDEAAGLVELAALGVKARS